jgi:hypothetical protein
VTVRRLSSSALDAGEGGSGATLLAAAQFPVSTTKLPVRFQFTRDNFERRRVTTSKQELDAILQSEDLLVEATCCPSVDNVDRNTATCLPLLVNTSRSILGKNQDNDDDDDEQEEVQEIGAAAAPVELLSASGIAKLLRLPGKDGGDANNVVVIRAAVSLPLHY